MSKSIHISGIFNRLYQKLRTKVNSEFLTYLLFLVIAIVIWYLNALNKDYTAEQKFKVRYVNLPEDKVVVKTPKNYLMLTVNAQGFTLLKYRLGLIIYPISIDAGYQSLRQSSTGNYYIDPQTIFGKISAQMSSDVRLQHIQSDTLKFLFSEMVQKIVPVKVQSQLQFEKSFLPIGDMKVTPTEIIVAGPGVIVDTMQYVYTKAKSFKRLKDTLRAELALQPIEMLKYSNPEIKIMQPVERHTEASITVHIEPINLPEDLKIKTFPGTVTVNCLVPVSYYEKLQPYMFHATVDYFSIRDIRDNQTKTRVSLTKSPDYVSDVRFHPKSVDYILEK